MSSLQMVNDIQDNVIGKIIKKFTAIKKVCIQF